VRVPPGGFAERLSHSIDRWGAGAAREQVDGSANVRFSGSPYDDARGAVAEDQIGEQRRRTGSADQLKQDEEVVGAIAQIWLEPAVLAAHADLHLAVTSTGLTGGPGDVSEPGDLHSVRTGLRVVLREHYTDALAQ
jgi:hypothetical protein